MAVAVLVVAVVAAAVALPRVSHIGCKPPGGLSEYSGVNVDWGKIKKKKKAKSVIERFFCNSLTHTVLDHVVFNRSAHSVRPSLTFRFE